MLTPVKYLVTGNEWDRNCIYVERIAQREPGQYLWRVCNDLGDVLNKLGEWEFDTLPSSRDDDYRHRCRWANLDAAYAAAALKHLETTIQTNRSNDA